MKRLALVVAALLAASTPAVADPADAPVCEGLDLAFTLSGLRSGEALSVLADADGVSVYDVANDRVLFTARCDGLAVAGPRDVPRPEQGRQAAATVVRDRAGATVYTHAVTARGARVTVIEPGQVNEAGLHVMAFDNDDVFVSDGLGRLVYSRTTTAEGALIEREGPAYGCGCERLTDPAGRVTVLPL